MSCANQNSDGSVVYASSSATQSSSPSPDIFKLNVDCFERIFEWLSLTELLTFRSTCKRMQQVVDYYIKLNYPELSTLIIYNRQEWIGFHSVRLNYFDWIKQLSIHTVNESLLRSLRITVPEIESIVYVLNRLEELTVDGVSMNGDFYQLFLKHCPLLKRLSVTTIEFGGPIIGTENQWLLRRYPSLEHFELHSRVRLYKQMYFPELVTFFKQNPQIRIFGVDSVIFDHHVQPMLESHVKFDRLDIYMGHNMPFICNSAKVLHENGFYRHLHLYNRYPHLIECEEHRLPTLMNLEKLHLDVAPEYDSPIPVVESIKELSIGRLDTFPKNTQKMMAENFSNLRRVDIHHAHMHDVRTFVCHAPKLHQIRIVDILDDESLTINHFMAMNEERKKLVGACKVKILIPERAFLKLKWEGKTKFSLIELHRINISVNDRDLRCMK